MSVSMVAAALSVAEFIGPRVVGLFAGKKGEKVAESVLGLAKSVTGANTHESAVTKIKSDPVVAKQFAMEVMANEEKLLSMAYADRADARDMYSQSRKTADEISMQIMERNLLSILILSLVQVAAIYVLQDDGAVLAPISGVFGFILKGLLDERKDVTGFYLGGSLDGRNKTEETRNHQ